MKSTRLHAHSISAARHLGAFGIAAALTFAGAWEAKAADKVIVALPSVDGTLSVHWIAQEMGFNKEENLEVENRFSPATQLPQLVSGQADIAYGSFFALLPAIRDGKALTVVFGTSGGGVGGVVAAGPDVKSIKECKQMAALRPSTGIGWAVAYKSAFKASYELVEKSDFPSVGTVLGAGLVDCAMGSAGLFDPYVKAGKVKILIDPVADRSTLPDSVKLINESGLVALKDHLVERKDVMERYIRSIYRSAVFLKTHPIDEIAALVKKNPDAGPLSLDAIKSALVTMKVAQIVHEGEIPASDWPFTLQWLKDGGMNFIDPSSRAWAYETVVDLSYFHRAVPKK